MAVCPSEVSRKVPASPPDCTQLACAIGRLRTAKGLTIEQVATATDMSAEELERIEDGLRDPSWRTLYKLAVALNTTAALLAPTPSKPGSPERGAEIVVRDVPDGRRAHTLVFYARRHQSSPPNTPRGGGKPPAEQAGPGAAANDTRRGRDRSSCGVGGSGAYAQPAPIFGVRDTY
ncbi:MAG: helix-turn-helix domain-containing protein [Solirubrobacteraceae bacterium]